MVSVGDGLSALTLIRELQPDLVLTDEHMPNLKGLDLIRRVKRDLPMLPVILMTAEGSETLAVEALRAGASDYLVKPFDAEHLLAAVGRAMTVGRRGQDVLKAQAESRAGAQSLERRLHELEALAHIGRTVTAMLDLDQVLTTVVELAVGLTEAEEGSLLLLDEESGELTMRASMNFDDEFARTFRLKVEDSLAGQVIASGQPVILDESAPQKIKTSYLVHSLLYVPLARPRQDDRRAGRRQPQGRALADQGGHDRGHGHGRLCRHRHRECPAVQPLGIRTRPVGDDPDADGGRRDRRRPGEPAAADQPHGGARPSRRTRPYLGRSLVETLEHPQILALMRAPGNAPRREEIELKDGRVVNAQRTPIDGVGQALVMQDITHLKELDRIKSEFVTTVSHDLRSPLTAILGYVELIERTGEVNDQQREFIRRVRSSVEHITALISDLLDLGRIEAGLDSARENTPLAVLARYAVETLRSVAENRRLTLEAELPEDLPLVNGDPIRLRQMIGNLLENALKYTPSGGRVKIEALAEADQVILRVTDTGPGIPPAEQPYLFDKFFRASNVPDDVSGTGLGLSIVKSIVDSHHGRIWVDSALGKGSRFHRRPAGGHYLTVAGWPGPLLPNARSRPRTA